MIRSFEELKKMYPVNQQYNCWGDKVPETAHESIEGMREFIACYIASDDVIVNDVQFEFSPYE